VFLSGIVLDCEEGMVVVVILNQAEPWPAAGFETASRFSGAVLVVCACFPMRLFSWVA